MATGLLGCFKAGFKGRSIRTLSPSVQAGVAMPEQLKEFMDVRKLQRQLNASSNIGRKHDFRKHPRALLGHPA
jgi:hypothetical protein